MTTSNNSPLINGAHVIIYSTNPDADRDFLKDVLALTHVDVGRGWLIFGLPPSEIAVHPADESGRHELYLMCDDVEHFVTQMRSRGLECAAVADQGWGLVTQMTLPGGGAVGVYQPRHPRPDPMK
jgi:catechol 2,3-dioxygenase-like lactoylglutathione lyase family enzyme